MGKAENMYVFSKAMDSHNQGLSWICPPMMLYHRTHANGLVEADKLDSRPVYRGHDS